MVVRSNVSVKRRKITLMRMLSKTYDRQNHPKCRQVAEISTRQEPFSSDYYKEFIYCHCTDTI